MLPLTGYKDEAQRRVMRIRNQEAWLSQDFCCLFQKNALTSTTHAVPVLLVKGITIFPSFLRTCQEDQVATELQPKDCTAFPSSSLPTASMCTEACLALNTVL